MLPDFLFLLLIGAILLLREPAAVGSAVKCRKHCPGQQKPPPPPTRGHQKTPLSDQFTPFDYDYPDYSSGVFVDAVPISPSTKRSIVGQAMDTKLGTRRNDFPFQQRHRLTGKVHTFEENPRRAEWYETLFATRR